MPTNSNPTIQAIKDSPDYIIHEHANISRTAKDFVRRSIPAKVKMKARHERDSERKMINRIHRIKRGQPVI